MVDDSTLQIFLTLYYGSLVTTFFYDYIVRNTLEILFDSLRWEYVTNVVIGVLFIAFCIWAILSVWSKLRRNLLITLIILLIIFVIRLAVGIPQYVLDKNRSDYQTRRNKEALILWIIQIVIHLFGVVATWFLYQRS